MFINGTSPEICNLPRVTSCLILKLDRESRGNLHLSTLHIIPVLKSSLVATCTFPPFIYPFHIPVLKSSLVATCTFPPFILSFPYPRFEMYTNIPCSLFSCAGVDTTSSSPSPSVPSFRAIRLKHAAQHLVISSVIPLKIHTEKEKTNYKNSTIFIQEKNKLEEHGWTDELLFPN